MSTAAAPAAYVIMGGKAFDSFLAEEALARVLDETLGAERGESLSVLRGDETTWARVLDAARTRSLFAERRMVVVRRADALKGEGEGLAAYLEGAAASGVVLVLLAAKLDRRRSVWKLLLEQARVIVVEPLKEAALRRRLLDELRRRRLEVEPQGIEEIVTRVGQDLGRVMGELDKLEAFARGRGQLAAEEVSACLGRGFAQPLYRLSDAFASRDGRTALTRLEEVLVDGEAPFMVLGTLYRALRQVRGAAGQSGSAWGELASRLGVPPFKVRDVLEAARRWSKADLRKALEALAEADQRIKTGVDGRVALTAAVALACGEGAVRPSLRPWR